MPAQTCRILLISGSLRGGSINTALLRTACEVAPAGVATVLYEGMAELPHFNPDDDAEGAPVHPAVAALRAAIHAADALLVSTPEYAGALPGSFKNLLEWTVGDASTYRKPIAWVNVSARGPDGGTNAHASLRLVLGYVHAEVVEDACVHIPVAHGAVGEDGLVADAAIGIQVAGVLAVLARHVESHTQMR
ncbi:MAG TPA: NADPH-dependent FMN reductase [Conexibacter sp.]|nr:NADPH-dependent FMN reductase [Conexibacter sp.]